jgi:hypothetical protein
LRQFLYSQLIHQLTHQLIHQLIHQLTQYSQLTQSCRLTQYSQQFL